MNKLLYLLPMVLFACAEPALTDLQRQEQQAARVEIIRDDYGVAHVYGQSDADAVFGLLYAQCEDDFKRVERNYIWAIGRLAEVEGEEAIYSDLRARLFMTKEEAEANFERAPEYIRKLCIAWADGINYYLYKNPEVQPALLTKFEPWMPMYFSEGSIGGDIERVSTRKIKEFYEPNTQVAQVENDSPLSEEEWWVEPKGSNGIAIAGDRTASGDAMLLINPHTTFYFRGEYHVVSQEGLNAYGAITWGQFFIYQGFNENTGWMHTSTYTDVIDEYLETIEERDGKRRYKYGNEWREVEETSVTLKYREGDAMRFRTFPMYRTHHGPVTHQIGDNWVATAMMWEPIKALEQSFIRTKMKNYSEFREMMNIRTNSSNNTVFADSEGNIGYFHGNFVPKRDTTFDFTQPVDGSNPDTDWKGLHPVDECITLLNPSNGWIQNCNSTPFTAAAENSPKKEDYPDYMSRIPENFRGVHARMMLPDARDLTLDGLIDLAYDPYLPAFEKAIPGLITAYDNNMGNYPNLAEPLEVLRNWDLTTSQESVAMSLAHFYGNSLKSNVQVPDTLIGMDRFHFFGTDLAEEERLNQFANAVQLLVEDFGRWDTPWGEICRFQRLSGDMDLKFDDEQESLPVGLTTAHWGALASFGTWSDQNTKRIYGTAGNSFVAVVQFGDSLRAKSLLAGGQSGDPGSPHFYDQAQLYADEQFKEVAFYRKDVEARAERRYRPGE